MRIAYLVLTDVSYEHGFLKKIGAQIRTWKEHGCEVKMFIVQESDKIWSGIKDIETELVPIDMGNIKRSDYLSYKNDLAKVIESWSPDLVYTRFGLKTQLYLFWRKTMANIPTIFEVNTDDLAEYKLLKRGRRLKNIYLFAGAHYLKWSLTRRAKGFVFVTNELSKACRSKVPKTVIANGIDLEKYPITAPPNNDRPFILFVGTPGQPWHGLEKVMEL
ncbi:MAG: glycosyltransferase, partial [Candidatus Peribacteraceae bacterium]|nr:glycosyltransferase [Candidatus Peribacteraceae bacterium]